MTRAKSILLKESTTLTKLPSQKSWSKSSGSEHARSWTLGVFCFFCLVYQYLVSFQFFLVLSKVFERWKKHIFSFLLKIMLKALIQKNETKEGRSWLTGIDRYSRDWWRSFQVRSAHFLVISHSCLIFRVSLQLCFLGFAKWRVGRSSREQLTKEIIPCSKRVTKNPSKNYTWYKSLWKPNLLYSSTMFYSKRNSANTSSSDTRRRFATQKARRTVPKVAAVTWRMSFESKKTSEVSSQASGKTEDEPTGPPPLDKPVLVAYNWFMSVCSVGAWLILKRYLYHGLVRFRSLSAQNTK